MGTGPRAMTLEEKVGQLMMMGIPGTQAGPEARSLIERHRVGGIMIFAENVETPEQVAKFTGDLQRIAEGSGTRLPLFIAIDQEGHYECPYHFSRGRQHARIAFDIVPSGVDGLVAQRAGL